MKSIQNFLLIFGALALVPGLLTGCSTKSIEQQTLTLPKEAEVSDPSPETSELPDLLNTSLTEAVLTLRTLDLTATYQLPDGEEDGTDLDALNKYLVIGQSPAAGTPCAAGDSVTLTLRKLRDSELTDWERYGRPQVVEQELELEGESVTEILTLLTAEDYSLYYNRSLLQVTAYFPQEKAALPSDGGELPEADRAIYTFDLVSMEESEMEIYCACTMSLRYLDSRDYQEALDQGGGRSLDMAYSDFVFLCEEDLEIGTGDYPFTYADYEAEGYYQNLIHREGLIEAPGGGALQVEMIMPEDAYTGFGGRMMAYLDTLQFFEED